MLDESLLDAPEALTRADTDDLLRGAAEAGARVRAGARAAAEAGLTALRPEGRPRAVLLAGPGAATVCAAELLGALGNGNAPVTALRPTGARATADALRWSLPGWVGPLDLLLVHGPEGTEPGLTALVEQAYRRGCTVLALTPERSPLADAVGETRGMTLPLPTRPRATGTPPAGAGEFGGSPARGAAAPPETYPGVPDHRTPPGALWDLLTPLLVLLDRLGLLHAPGPAVEALADRLDETARNCGPARPTYGNPAKTLATELADTFPLLWSEGRAADAVARAWAGQVAARLGRPALAAPLPEAIAAHGPLLAGAFAPAADLDDFFRDRVDEPEPTRARVVLLRDTTADGESATGTARDLALAHHTPISELDPTEGGGALEAAAELFATLEFATVYLTLASDASAGP
ncbi:mannose-6-phosphate isomerase [Streptomyces sp. AJS327]|uniref:SIS domain-containing protein n=1 Tax=Streptomyces sp. AJS327 TaxID=2545265 RepID=UPI0015DED84A|nr:SIS domain-containing protein [Streptomyces sp. AJS327]MBA0049482.1 mannose-6-phosphate isomerase [Streptomyces sp. AJS327]